MSWAVRCVSLDGHDRARRPRDRTSGRARLRLHHGDARHDDLVDPATEIAGQDAEQGSDGSRHDDGGEADHHRDPRAEDEPGGHVASEMVRAQDVRGGATRLPEGRLEAIAQVAHFGIVGRDEVGEDRHHGEPDQDGAGDVGESLRPERGEAPRDGEAGGTAARHCGGGDAHRSYLIRGSITA